MNIQNQYEGFLNTPALFDEIFKIGQFNLKEVKNKNKNITELNIPNNIPLGKRLEYFFEYFINSSLNFKVVAKNIQIFDGNQTLGEIDFIIKDTITNQFYHIEFVYKYYLYFPKEENIDEINSLIGPNLNDSFIKKLKKLENKQFSILNHKKAKNILQKIGAQNIIQKTVFLGNIFLPKNKTIDFKKINNSCVKGFYITFNEFILNENEYIENYYFLPHKFDWVVDPSKNKEWKNYEKIKDEVKEFINLNKSPLVWMKTKEDNFFMFFITYYETI